jgi:hypothetical protein
MNGFCLPVFQNIMLKKVIRIEEAGSTIKQTWQRYKDFKTYRETRKARNVPVVLPGLSSHTTADRNRELLLIFDDCDVPKYEMANGAEVPKSGFSPL